MHFTREPIIETVISAREGHKLTIQSSKDPAAESFALEAVEIVSFGQALFFRSLERSKHFLLPVSDYQVVQSKEVRVGLKAALPERTVKIGGGKEGKPVKEKAKKKEEKAVEEEVKEPILEEEETVSPPSLAVEKKTKERRRNRKRKTREKEEDKGETVESKPVPTVTLLPPPSTLISETLAHYKSQPEFRQAFIDTTEEEVDEAIPEETAAHEAMDDER